MMLTGLFTVAMCEMQITEETVRELDRVRAEIERETGRTVSRKELLARMVEHAWDRRDEVVDSFRDR